MALGTQITAINAVTTQIADSDSVDLTAVANRFALFLVATGQVGKPTMNVWASMDNENWAMAEPVPQPQFGRALLYEVPARYVRVTLGGNNGTASVFLVGLTD